LTNITKNSSEIVWNACCRIKKEILSDLDIFLSDEDFIACLTSLKVVDFHAIVFKSSDFKAVAVDSEDDENIVFKNILNFFWKVISRLFSCWIDEILTTFLDLMK